jgi:hypothetical protein
MVRPRGHNSNEICPIIHSRIEAESPRQVRQDKDLPPQTFFGS